MRCDGPVEPFTQAGATDTTPVTVSTRVSHMTESCRKTHTGGCNQMITQRYGGLEIGYTTRSGSSFRIGNVVARGNGECWAVSAALPRTGRPAHMAGSWSRTVLPARTGSRRPSTSNGWAEGIGQGKALWAGTSPLYPFDDTEAHLLLPALVEVAGGRTFTYGDVVVPRSPNTVLFPAVLHATTAAGGTVTTLSSWPCRPRTPGS